MTRPRGGTIGDRGGAVPGLPVQLDDFGVLRCGDAWVSLSPTQELIMRALIGRLGEAVGRGQLVDAVWPDGAPDSHAIDVHIHKLRPRVEGLGLVIHTLRGRGFMLETSGGRPAAGRR